MDILGMVEILVQNRLDEAPPPEVASQEFVSLLDILTSTASISRQIRRIEECEQVLELLVPMLADIDENTSDTNKTLVSNFINAVRTVPPSPTIDEVLI